MAILTIEDKSTYFPSVELDGQSLAAIINQSQVIAEGSSGANRPLEMRKYVDVLQLHSSGLVLLPYMPILTTPTAPLAPTVEIRWKAPGGVNPYYGSLYGSEEWQLVQPEEYEIDYDRGELKLNGVPSLANFISFMTPVLSMHRTYNYRQRALGKNIRPQVRVTYYAGFDFTNDSDLAVIALKTALGGIVSIRGSNGAIQSLEGVKSFALENFYNVSYGSENALDLLTTRSGKNPMDDYLGIFRKYRPRSFVR